ncbi:NAD(P)-binding protein [Podospora australis]|uniref:NAD(P)-binding protein n=1 Tax=Podospora australis TaxID=1536484 RepID=A0AAN6WMY0_9PEZI|nr:NAD(P)-binding protein [Podospora australis]
MAVLFAKDQPAGFSNYIENVAIIGAGGQIGGHLASALLQTGKHKVTAITRPSSTNKIHLSGLNIVKADYGGDADDSDLVAALRGNQALIITMAVSAPRDTVTKLIAAAAKADVKYIFPNWFGHDPANDSLCKDSFLTEMRDNVRAEIARHGVSSYIFLACNFWYEFSLGGGPDRYGFDFQNNSLILFDKGDVPINTSTWPQCGRAVASLLTLKVLPDDDNDKSTTLQQFGNKTVYISSFRLTQKDMFEAVKRVTGTTEADWTITHESAEQRWKDGFAEVLKGNFGAFTKMLYSRMFFQNGDGEYESKRGTDNAVLGLPVEDLDEATKIAVRMGKNGEVTGTHRG